MNINEARILLGLSLSFTDEELKTVYRKMCKKYHPDVNLGKNTEEKMKEINIAFDILKKHIDVVGGEPIDFKMVKTNKLFELQEIFNNLKTLKIHDFNKKNVDLYIKAREKETQIYKEYIEAVENSKNLDALNNIESKYENKIENLKNLFVERLFSNWEFDLTFLKFYKDLKNRVKELEKFCKEGISVNDVIKRFKEVQKTINDENDNLEKEVSNAIGSRIEEKIIKYKSCLYYEILRFKIDQIKDETFKECMKIRISYDYQANKSAGESNIKNLINSLDEKINQLFNDYMAFLSKKQEKMLEIKSLSENCPLNHKDQINILLISLEEKLNLVEDYTQLENWFKSSKNDIDLVLKQIDRLVEKERKQSIINDIKIELLSKFNLLENESIEDAQINSSILSRSLKCLLLAKKGELKFENILYLKQISFRDVINDKNILNFVANKSQYIAIPMDINSVISDEKLLKLYKKIKPIVDVEHRKFLIREFALNELKTNPFLNGIDENIEKEIDASKLELVGEFECYHTISSKETFEPKISDVLAQMPIKITVNAAFFEIVGAPKLVKDINFKDSISPSYHLSKVKVFGLKK